MSSCKHTSTHIDTKEKVIPMIDNVTPSPLYITTLFRCFYTSPFTRPDISYTTTLINARKILVNNKTLVESRCLIG